MHNMHNLRITAGALFEGINTGPTNFNGKNFVEVVDGQNVHAGSEFDGEQRGVLFFNENNTVKNLMPAGQQEKEYTDQSTGSFKVQQLQSIPRVGDTVIVRPAGNNNLGMHCINEGSVTIVNVVHGKIINDIFYRGGVPDSVSLCNFPSNSEIHWNIGSLTIAGEVENGVDFNADIHIKQ